MRKILSLILVLILSLSVMNVLVACNVPQKPDTSDEYLYNDTHHWRLNNGQQVDYAQHTNPRTEGAGRCTCGYYFPCHNLVYEKTTVDGVVGYKVKTYDSSMSPNFYHVEVPKYYQGEDDTAPLPVISIGASALRKNRIGVAIKSVKLHEGLLQIEDWAFSGSDLSEIVIPNSVKGSLHYTFASCANIKRVVIGNGITSIQGYTFQNLTACEEVIVGNSVREIKPRSFIGCWRLKTVVLPESLVSMPEGTEASQNGTVAPIPQTVIFEKNEAKIFFQITRQELEERTIPLFQRDALGNLLNPDGTIAHRLNEHQQQSTFTTYGLNANWAGSNKVYCLGEWSFDSNGKPKVN